MGNSISSSSKGGNTTNRPGGSNSPLTINANDMQDGHYVAFYTGLDGTQINNICMSMNGVATITDLTLIIAHARATKTLINSKYSIKNIKLAADDTTITNTDSSTADDTATNTKSNEFGVTIDKNYYMIISSMLFEAANKEKIDLLRSINDSYPVKIFIGSNYSSYVTSYFDAYITDDFTDMVSSTNPANAVEKMKIFLELPAVPTILFNMPTLQLQYNSRYAYIAVCKLVNLQTALAHINTIRNNANLMSIYYYDANDKFLADAFKIFVEDDTTINTTLNATYNIFSVGHSSPNSSNQTVKFLNRTIPIKPNTRTSDFTFKLAKDQGDLEPVDISKGFQQKVRLFGKVTKYDIPDNVTQVFPTMQTIQLTRSDFQLYIGFIDPRNEVDIIGTLLNGINIPKSKFILYIKENIIGSYTLPKGLYKTSTNNGITNIYGLQNGTNISDDYYLTLGLDSTANIKDYDIVNIPDTKLKISTLRNNHTVSKQALFASHTGDMKESGAYIPASELILPASYSNDQKLVIVCAVDTTPTAVWNMAKILKNKYKYHNWILYFSILPAYQLGECTGYTIQKQDNNMIVLTSDSLDLNLTNTKDFFEITTKNNPVKLFKLSQTYQSVVTRREYISSFTVYPYKVASNVAEYQQYKYLIIQNLSYIAYDTTDLQYSTKDVFIGGMANTLTLYANTTRFDIPIIDQESLTGRPEMYIDYFPTIDNVTLMNSYITVFTNFMSQGSNNQLIKYTCLMRVRKVWLKNNTPDIRYFAVIEDKNTDYALIFLYGGSASRFLYDKTTHEFSMANYQSLFLDTAIAKSDVPQLKHVYIENPLDEIIKPSDEERFLNGPINASWTIRTNPITSYPHKDFLSLYFAPYEEKSRSLVLNGSVLQKDISYSRYTFLSDEWTYFVYNLTTLVTNETPSNANSLIFINVTTFSETNVAIPSLKESINTYIKANTHGPFESFTVLYDNLNKLYTITNIDVLISAAGNYYTFNRMRMYIKSQYNPNEELQGDNNLLLDITSPAFRYDANSILYSSQTFGLRIDISTQLVTYPQVDKIANRAAGVSVETDNTFWNSIRSFVYINDLERFEVDNLVQVMDYLSVNLEGFFICSLVSYDNTTAESWIYERCIVIRGNRKTKVTITSKNNRMYYIVIRDPTFDDNFMKFGIWYDKINSPTSSDITDVDFIINKFTGTHQYDGTMKVYPNERIGVGNNYIQFLFPDDTITSFPKFTSFTTGLNKYILFARPIEKIANTTTYIDGVCELRIKNIKSSISLDFSEIINFVVQWFALTKNSLIRVIIRIEGLDVIKRPDKNYRIIVDNLIYDTNDFTFTDDARIIIYPKVEYNTLYANYQLSDNVYYFNASSTPPKPVPDNQVHYIASNTDDTIAVKVGPNSGYTKWNDQTVNHLNMRMLKANTISKK